MTDSTITAPVPTAAGAPAPSERRNTRTSSTVRSALKHAALILASVLMIYPLLWMLVSSFRPNELIFRDPGLILTSLHLENYTVGWSALTNPFGHYMLNSAIVVLGCIFGNVVSCSLAAYAFARLRFTLKNVMSGNSPCASNC